MFLLGQALIWNLDNFKDMYSYMIARTFVDTESLPFVFQILFNGESYERSANTIYQKFFYEQRKVRENECFYLFAIEIER